MNTMGISSSISGESVSSTIKSITEHRNNEISEEQHSENIATMFTVLFEEGILSANVTTAIKALGRLAGNDTLRTFLEDETYFRALARLVAHFQSDTHTMLDHLDPEMHQLLIEHPSVADDIIQFSASGRVFNLSNITPDLLAETLITVAPLRSGVL